VNVRLEASDYRRRRGGGIVAVVRVVDAAGAILFADTLRLTDRRDRAAFIRELATRLDGTCADLGALERSLLDLLAQAEAALAADLAPPGPAATAPADEERVDQYVRSHAGTFLVRRREVSPGIAAEERVPLANFSAEIAEDVELDDGAESRRFFVIRGRLGDQPLPDIRVSVAEFAAMNWPTAAWGVTARVAPGAGRKDYLRDAIQAFSASARQRTIYAHTGWRRVGDRWLFLHAGGALGADGPVPDIATELPPQLGRYLLPPPADRDTLRSAVQALVRVLDLGDPQVTYPALAAALAPPLAPVLGGLGFVVWLLGPTGRWKSTLQALLCNVYSADARFTDKDPPTSWESTDNALERLAFLAKDLPLWVDDFRPPATPREATELERRAQRLIREAANQVGRDRMRADTSLRPSLPPRALVWSSGELLPGGTSTLARLIVVDVPAGWTSADQLRTVQAAAGQYAVAGTAWITHLAGQLDELRRTLPKTRDALRDALLAQVHHPQHALAAAKLITAFAAWLEHCVKIGALSPDDAAERLVLAREAIVAAARRSGDYAGEERPGRRFLELVRVLLRQRRAHLRPIDGARELDHRPDDDAAWGWPPPAADGEFDRGDGGVRPPPTPHLGWVDEEEGIVYLLPTPAVREVAEYSRSMPRRWLVSPETLGRDLAACGLLVRTDAGKHLLRKRVGDQRVYVWALRAADVRGDADAGEDAGEGAE
jgi:hypothetical protein